MPAQSSSLVSGLDDVADAIADSATSTVAPKSPKDAKPLTGRWLDLTTFSHSQRYRN